MRVVQRKKSDGRGKYQRHPASVLDGWVPAIPKNKAVGRPRNAVPPRDDGFSEGTVRNVIARYGTRRIAALIQAWKVGEKTDGQLARKFGVSRIVMRKWREAFGIRLDVWTPFDEISALSVQDPTE